MILIIIIIIKIIIIIHYNNNSKEHCEMHSKLMASWDEIIKYMIRIGKGDRVFVCVCVCV